MVIGILEVSVASADYLRLEAGNRWSYSALFGAHETHVVTGTAEVDGHETYVIQYQQSTENDGLEQYWTTQPDGDALIWGFYRQLEGFGWLYRPPIVVVDAPLFEGKTWHQRVARYDLPDTAFLDSLDIFHEVTEEGLVSVPAGSFHSFGIADSIPVSLVLRSAGHNSSRHTAIRIDGEAMVWGRVRSDILVE
jgi:hypothetical protein